MIIVAFILMIPALIVYGLVFILLIIIDVIFETDLVSAFCSLHDSSWGALTLISAWGIGAYLLSLL